MFMSKFCGVCGAEMRDDALICSNCGNQLGNADGVYAQTDAVYGQGVPAKKSTDFMNKIKDLSKLGGSKYVKIFAPIAAAVIVLIIVLSIILSSFSYKNTVKKYVKAVEKNDATVAEKIISKTILDFAEDEDEDFDASDLLEDDIDNIRDIFDDELDSKYSISYEILSVKDMDKGDINEFNEEMEDLEDIDFSISKGKTVKVSIKAKSGKDTETYKKTLILVKEKGKLKWTIIPYAFY